jgi:hypothetical protein
MSEVILKFPSSNHIADFIVNHNLKSVEVDSARLIVKGYLTEDELITACHEYQARLLEDFRAGF